MKNLWLVGFILCISPHQLHADLTTINCGTPRKTNGDPGLTNYSISIMRPSTGQEEPRFYLVTTNIFQIEKTVTEPLQIEGRDMAGRWLFRGEDSTGLIHQDFIEGSIRFFSGRKLSLYCR